MCPKIYKTCKNSFRTKLNTNEVSAYFEFNTWQYSCQGLGLRLVHSILLYQPGPNITKGRKSKHRSKRRRTRNLR